MDSNRLQQLFTLFYNKTASGAERAELMELILQASPQQLERIIVDQGLGLQNNDFNIEPGKAEIILQSILSPQAVVVSMDKDQVSPAHGRANSHLIWVKYVAAASVILLLASGSYFVFFKKPPEQQFTAQEVQPGNDVKAPDQNRAMITLANGKIIYLDSVKNGTIAREGEVAVLKLADGQIVYDNSGTGTESSLMAYNTISNPAGSSVIDIVLADGSRVWLNAASSLTYPVTFSAKERKVSITGEAFFEVAKNASKPFKVQFNETVVEVLGTHFNINAYADEPFSKTTLLEGAIKINNGQQQQILAPGNQAVIKNEYLNVLSNVDTSEAVAWKNKYFQFNSADIETIMRQTARWYNIQVSYKGAIPSDRFTGKISRNVNLSEFLKVLQYSEVNFKIVGEKIIVMP